MLTSHNYMEVLVSQSQSLKGTKRDGLVDCKVLAWKFHCLWLSITCYTNEKLLSVENLSYTNSLTVVSPSSPFPLPSLLLCYLLPCFLSLSHSTLSLSLSTNGYGYCLFSPLSESVFSSCASCLSISDQCSTTFLQILPCANATSNFRVSR